NNDDEIGDFDGNDNALPGGKGKKYSKRRNRPKHMQRDDLNPVMRKTIVYNQNPASGANDDYYEEIVETTWVVKLGSKNLTDKQMLDYLNTQLKATNLFQDVMKQNNSDPSGN
ncbi:unnamed protein product, partial [Trichobilharzia regenti]